MGRQVRPQCLLFIMLVSVSLIVAGCATKIDPNHPEIGLRQAAERGDVNAAVVLGVLYEDGAKVPQDFSEAKKWFAFAADKGNALGQFELGLVYQNGKGVPVNLPRAIALFEASAEHGFAAAKASLGMLYMKGTGVPQDEARGRALMHEAAIKGFAPAQMMMAVLYLGGTNGVQADDSLAYQWSSLAASKLNGIAAEFSKRTRSAAEKGLTPDDISSAQAATAKWTPGTDLVSVIPPGGPPRPPRLRSQGSGFIIGKGGEIVTAYHVVPNCREIRVKDPAEKFNIVTHMLAEDRTNDLSVLASGGFGSRLKLSTEVPTLGGTIVTYGFPLGTVLATSGNMTSGTVSSTTGMAGNAKSFQITAPVQPGSSGGPVVDESGAVLGIVASKLNALAVASATGDIAQNVNFAWRADALKSLLEEHGIAFEAAHGKSTPLSTSELVGQLQKAAVKVECWR